ncbi:MAG: TldD/PmbA family protein [Chloroflexi bacterium]|nr:TldD/PmbA family protein [Chloroflexota bacterium]
MEDILSRAKKVAEQAEVFTVSSEETNVQFETNRLKHIQSKQSTSLSLRIVKHGKVGYASTTNLDNPDLVDAAVETARFGVAAKFDLPAKSAYPTVEIFDSDASSISLEKMAQLGEEMIANIRKHTPELICEASVSRSVISVRLLNSRGGEASYQQTVFGLGVEGQLIRDTDMLFVGESQSSCHPILEAGNITKVVVQQLERAKDRASAPTKSLPVIFTPNGVASALTTPLMIAFNGKTVLEGASPIGNKLGQRVFDERLQLRDDPTLPYCPSSCPCDDEGIPSQRIPLIESGTVSNFLYDLQTAGLANTRSTGSGRRGRGGLPSPSPSAFIITPGKTPFDEMVADIKEGLVVEQLMGATQGNVLGGDFSGNVLLGYKVEHGKIIGRVKDTMVSGNIYQLLKEVTIGSEAKWVGGFLNTPPLYFSKVSVASK